MLKSITLRDLNMVSICGNISINAIIDYKICCKKNTNKKCNNYNALFINV